MFASQVFEQEPPHWGGFPIDLETWVQIMGGFSAAALLIYLIVRFFRGPARTAQIPWPLWQVGCFRVLVAGMFVGYLSWFVLMAPVALSALVGLIEGGDVQLSRPIGSEILQRGVLLIGAGSAFLAVALPFLADLLQARWRWRRIWALARLSFKDAVRGRVLWVCFAALVLVVLFANWFLPYKSENQLRNYVTLVYLASAILLLMAASLLAAFSLPADMRNQTIHTIVTKPVERFEIVLGRFIGYTILMSFMLVASTGAGYIYLSREIDPDAAFESMKARVPVYGELYFRGKEGTSPAGMNVGREWGYRSYIMGGTSSSHRAVWNFVDFPDEIGRRPPGSVVRCEFSLDIFRTLKGEEGKPVFCTFVFQTRNWDPRQESEYRKAREQVKALQAADRRGLVQEATKQIRGDTPSEEEIKAFTEDRDTDAVARLFDRLFAEKYGIYEVFNKGIVDYHTQWVDVPAAFFKNAFAKAPPPVPMGFLKQTGEAIPTPLFNVSVKCESGGQYIGAAKHDLYILAAEGSFAWNFFKGAIGLWMRLCIVIGLAVTCSTYLSGVISWLLTLFLYLAGVFQDYVKTLVEGNNPEGGPMTAMIKLVTKSGISTPMDQTPGAHIAQGTDAVFRVIFRVVLYVLPEPNRLDWKDYVAEGFNIGGADVILYHLLLLIGYLTPVALIAYYLMKSREVAA